MTMAPLGGRRKIPPGWRVVTLDEIKSSDPDACRAGPFGSSISRKYFVSAGVPVIRGNNLTTDLTDFIAEGFVFVTEERAHTKYRSCLARPGDLVLTCWGTIGQVGRIPENGPFDEYVISNKQLKLRTDPRIANSKFVYYYVASKAGVEYIESRSIGAAVPGINLGILKSIPIALPPMRQQEAIVAVLSAYDDLIENNRRRIQLLEQAARLLYQEWFVHLRFPGHEHVTITDRVPEGWRRTTLGEFIDNESISLQTGPFGTQLKASDYTADGTPVINVRNIGYGAIQPEKIEFLPEQKVLALSKHILHRGDIVFGRKGAVDRHVLIGPDQDGWMQGSDCIRMRITGHDITPNLVSIAFREDGHKQWMLGQCGNKATMASLNQDVISRIPILIPSHEMLAVFDEFAVRILSQIAVLNRQAEKAASARDLLLPRLMNGEIPV